MYSEHIFKSIYGCLMGVACGDAIGMPTSMLSPDRIRIIFPEGISKFEPAPNTHPIHQNYIAGQTTDDTQQTLIIAQSIIEDKEVNARNIAHRILKWAEESNGFQSLLLGPSSLRALQSLRDGVDIKETGTFGDTNGAAMRIAPIGIINLGNVEGTIRDVQKACLATHNTNIAISGASSVACAIGLCIPKKPSLDEIIDIGIVAAERGMTCGNQWIGASISRRIQFALDIVRRAESKNQVLQDLYELVGATVATTETVPVSFALVYYAAGDPLETIQLAANLGGDADTIGAIAGSIAGAYAGIDAFPQEYIEIIESVNSLKLEQISKQLSDFVVKKLKQ
jgi:ADP-ribosylglycohydrolase